MANIRINILKKGDSVLFLNQDIIAVQRKNGEVDIFKLFYDENNLPRLDTKNKSTIGFGDGAITVALDDNSTQITTFQEGEYVEVKKDQSVVAVIDGLTSAQAADIQADIIKSKNRRAPGARGTIAQGNRQDVGKMLNEGQNEVKKLEAKGDSDGKKK